MLQFIIDHLSPQHLFSFLLLSVLGLSLYRAYLHPLRHIPGPLTTKLSSLWLYYHTYIGDQCSQIHKLHEKYGPIVQIGPYDVDIADGEALAPIYIQDGGFDKSSCYSNFDLDGHASMFSALTSAQRAPWAKAVLPIFSMAAIRGATNIMAECANSMIERMRKEAKAGPVDVLNLTRSFAADSLSAYVFEKPYGAIYEDSSRASVSAYVDTIIASGGFFYLPRSLFILAVWALGWNIASPNKTTPDPLKVVDSYVQGLVDSTKPAGHTFQGRLLSHGIPKDETRVQCEDAVFAGTETTGNNLAFICWNLAAHPGIYARLRKELQDHPDVKDIQSLPYLTGVVKEALRLSMATPCRFPRVVPPTGWTYNNKYHIPPGTNVGIAPFELHLNPTVFPNPKKFEPERWAEPSVEMQRDWMPFGKGGRSCIARNLALMELFVATERIAREDVMRGARTAVREWEYWEYFNARIKGDKVEIVWGNDCSDSEVGGG